MAENRVLNPADSQQDQSRAQRRSLKQTVRDMVLSVGVVAAIIFAVLALTWRPQPDPVRVVDARPVARAAAATAAYPILFPDLPADWRATSARFAATEESNGKPVWFNGWVTPEGEYAAIVQAKTTDEDFVAEQTANGLPVPGRSGVPTTLAEWDAYVTRDGDQRSLVRQDDWVTTIVTGTLDWAGLAAFVDRLQPVTPAS